MNSNKKNTCSTFLTLEFFKCRQCLIFFFLSTHANIEQAVPLVHLISGIFFNLVSFLTNEWTTLLILNSMTQEKWKPHIFIIYLNIFLGDFFGNNYFKFNLKFVPSPIIAWYLLSQKLAALCQLHHCLNTAWKGLIKFLGDFLNIIKSYSLMTESLKHKIST